MTKGNKKRATPSCSKKVNKNEQPVKTNPYEKFVFFWKDKYVFSNFYPASYTLDGITFKTSEQGLMYEKAKLFKDEETMQQILECERPRDAKALGRLINNFNGEIWGASRESLFIRHLIEKFTQNPELKEILLQTDGKHLVEASPNDSVWGIGLNEKEARRISPYKWPGKNILGKLLDRTREFIKDRDIQEQQQSSSLILLNNTTITMEDENNKLL
ncbi:hypothetical protein ABK040_001098 [Willaertia magna]